MPLLPNDVSEQIKDYLKVMENPVTIVYFTDGKYPTTKETQELLEEVSALNDKLILEVKDIAQASEEVQLYDIQRVPSFVMLDKEGTYRGIKFNGIPAGHEINSFLNAIIEMSGVRSPLSEENINRIRKIAKPVNIKVFVTLSCPHCPGAVEKANRLAVENSNIKAEMIEAQTFTDLSKKYNVSSVPRIVVNDKEVIIGNQPIEEFLSAIERA